MSMLFTNKKLVQITPSEAYWALLVSCTGLPESGKDFTLSNSGYYLIDRVGSSCDEKGLQQVFSKAFEQELAESGVPKERWPNTRDFAVFKTYFRIDIHPLIADLGQQPLQTGKLDSY